MISREHLLDRRVLILGSIGVIQSALLESSSTKEPKFGMIWNEYIASGQIEKTYYEIGKNFTGTDVIFEADINADKNSPMFLEISPLGTDGSSETQGNLLSVSFLDDCLERIVPVIISPGEVQMSQMISIPPANRDNHLVVRNITPGLIPEGSLSFSVGKEKVDPVLEKYRSFCPYVTGDIDLINDMFVCIFGHIRQNKDFYLFEYSGLRLDEDGGMSDKVRMRKYGSYRDADAIISLLVNKYDLSIKDALFQGEKHVWNTHNLSTVEDDHLYVRYISQNHMVSDQLIPGNHFVCTVPVLLYYDQTEVDIRTKYRSIDHLSKKEVKGY